MSEKYTDQEQDNMRIWSQVCETDPRVTKRVNKRGGFTAIDAQTQIKRATEMWGPYGTEWGIMALSFEVFDGPDGAPEWIVCNGWFKYPGTDGFPISADAKYDPSGELTKKLVTECTSKALSKLGFNSDVFEGKFDDSRYVESMLKKTAEQEDTARFMEAVKQITTARNFQPEDYVAALDEFKVESASDIESPLERKKFTKYLKEMEIKEKE